MNLKPGKYLIDCKQSKVSFSVVNFLVLNVKGTFDRFEGAVEVGSEFSATKVNASIQVNSINTDWEGRDDHLMKDDFFHVEKYPLIEFTSRSIMGAPEQFTMTGDLTMHGVTRSITMACRMTNPFTVQSEASINRKDFGLTAGPSIKNEVKILINIKLMPS